MPRDRLRAFLFSHDPIAAWVAEVDGVVAGHVALHHRSLDETMVAACEALAVDEAELAVVARLFVGPAGRGVGGALLDHATAAARARGLLPILDTWQGLHNAVALYDHRGWRRLAALPAAVGDETIDIFVYVAPAV